MDRPKHQHADRGVAYVRTSTNRQDLSPAAQREAIEAWAARHRVAIVAWAEDVGVSGGVHPLERPGFGEALHAMDVHRAGTLLVARLDRLSRSALDYAVLEADLAKHRRRIITADGVANDGTAESKLIRSVLAAIGEYERRLIGARTRAALANTVSNDLGYLFAVLGGLSGGAIIWLWRLLTQLGASDEARHANQ